MLLSLSAMHKDTKRLSIEEITSKEFAGDDAPMGHTRSHPEHDG